MKKLIAILKKWNKAYPEYDGLLRIYFYDDESGSIGYQGVAGWEEIFTFYPFKVLIETDPKTWKKERS